MNNHQFQICVYANSFLYEIILCCDFTETRAKLTSKILFVNFTNQLEKLISFVSNTFPVFRTFISSPSKINTQKITELLVLC